MRLFFVALLTRFSAVLLSVTERRTYVLVLPAGTNKAPGAHEQQWLGRAFCSACWVYHKLYLSEALGGWIYCRNGCFTRFAGYRCCSSGQHCAVRVAAAGNCTQGISQPTSALAGFRKSGSLIRLPLLLTMRPSTWQGRLIRLPCRWTKHWVAIRYIKIAKLYHFFLEGVSFWGGPCGLYIMGGIFSAAKFPSGSPNF